MTRQYETVLIFKPELNKEALENEVNSIVEFLKQRGAYAIDVDNWGQRKLAYPMAKKNYGSYFCIYFTCDQGSVVNELTAHCRLNENLLRYQTHKIVINKKLKEQRSRPSEGGEAAA